MVTPYVLQPPSKIQRKGQCKVVDLSVKESTIDQSVPVDSVGCFNQSSVPHIPISPGNDLPTSSNKVTDGVKHTEVLMDIEIMGSDCNCSNQSSVSEDPGLLDLDTPLTGKVQCFNQTILPQEIPQKIAHLQSLEYSHGPSKPRNLCTLAMSALSHHFPGLDPLNVAVLFTQCQCKAVKSSQNSPHELKELCKLWLCENFPISDIYLALADLQTMTKNETNYCHEVNIDAYLKNQACKKVTVTVSKLSNEVIQLWTKTHWSQLDPYSDIDDEAKSDKSENATDPVAISPMVDPKQSSSSQQSALIGGHVLRCRKRHYTTDRPHREGAHTFYRDMCLDRHADYLPSKPKVSIGLKTPSCDRIRMQDRIRAINKRKRNGETVNARLTRSYKLLQLIRKPKHEIPEPEPDQDSESLTVMIPSYYLYLGQIYQLNEPSPVA